MTYDTASFFDFALRRFLSLSADEVEIETGPCGCSRLVNKVGQNVESSELMVMVSHAIVQLPSSEASPVH